MVSDYIRGLTPRGLLGVHSVVQIGGENRQLFRFVHANVRRVPIATAGEVEDFLCCTGGGLKYTFIYFIYYIF